MDYQNNSSGNHVLNSNFGLGVNDKDLELWEFVATHTIKKGIVKKLILSEIYDEYHNICNHNDLSKPLSLVTLHNAESYMEQSLEYRKMREFSSLQIGKYFNLSFLEYITLPMSAHEFMVKIATEMIKKTSKTIEEFKDQMEEN